MCHKLFKHISWISLLMLTASLQGSYYCYPHLIDEKMRHRRVKQNVQGHTAGKQCWTQCWILSTGPKTMPPIISPPFSSVLLRLQPNQTIYLMSSLTIGNDFPFLHLFLSNPTRHCWTSSCFWSSPFQQDSPLHSKALLCPSLVICHQRRMNSLTGFLAEWLVLL